MEYMELIIVVSVVIGASALFGVNAWMNEVTPPLKVLNAWSMKMVESFPCRIHVKEISVERAAKLAAGRRIESCVGHDDAAQLYTDLLGVEIPRNRVNTRVAFGEQVLVGQYDGPRLPEGAKELPEGASIKWLLVTPKTRWLRGIL